MKTLFILSIIFWAESCSESTKKKDTEYSLGILEFSYTDSYEEIMSFRVDSNKLFLISKNDSLRYGILPDTIFSELIMWHSDVMKNPEKYRIVNKCENCPELVIKINTYQDTLIFLKEGKLDKKTIQVIASIRNLYHKIVTENLGSTLFETRSLIRPKPPMILPVSF